MSNLAPIQALPGYVLIQPRDETEELKGSAGSFFTAQSVKDSQTQQVGKVLDIGKPVVNEYGMEIRPPEGIKKGSTVIHTQYGASSLKYHGESVKFVKFQDIVGTIHDKT